MLSLEFIKNNYDLVQENLRKRGSSADLKKILQLDEERRKIITTTERLQEQRNILSKEKPGEKGIEEGKKLKQEIKKNLDQLKEVQKDLDPLLLSLPNLLHDSVPEGEEGVVVKKVGEPPKFSFPFKSYLELNNSLDLIDTSRAAKIAGARFAYLKREAVLLEFALIRFTLDVVLPHNFVPILPPLMIKPTIMESLGYGGLAQQDTYLVEKDHLNLIGTSEHSIGAMYKDEILDEKTLPRRFLGFSTCFRREAGSYGRDVKGIIREHQFDKLEMFSFCLPEKSEEEYELLRNIEKELMQKLELPYQVRRLGAKDMAASSSITIDLETWIPSENRYRETHSCSNCTDYQARGLNIRYRSKDGKINFVHTLNGTAFAIGRILIAILENYQQKDGRVLVPKILQPYLHFKEIKR